MTDQPIAWGMPRPDGTIIDCITPEEHAREPGQYTVPLYTQPKAEQEPVGTYEEVMQTMRSLQTGTLVAQQQMFALLKDKPLYAAPQPKAEPVAWWVPKAEQFCIKKPGERDLYGQLNTTEKEVDDLRLMLRQALHALKYRGANEWKVLKPVIEAIKERLG
jgi:hypothetical protein